MKEITFAVLQAMANGYAQKLGITEKITVSEPSPICKPNPAHCHIDGLDRGRICVDIKKLKRWLKQQHWTSLKGQRLLRWLIAHEVCHLKVKSHSSPYFNRYMGNLGFTIEKQQAQAAGLIRHRHIWVIRWNGETISRKCRICGAVQDGKITWGRTK